LLLNYYNFCLRLDSKAELDPIIQGKSQH